MTRAIKITIIVTLLLTVVREMAAQEKNQIHKTEVSVDFRWDWAVIDFDYMGTGKTLSNLRALIRGIGMANIDSLEVISYSSPEGRFDYNLNLSKRRWTISLKHTIAFFRRFRSAQTGNHGICSA